MGIDSAVTIKTTALAGDDLAAWIADLEIRNITVRVEDPMVSQVQSSDGRRATGDESQSHA